MIKSSFVSQVELLLRVLPYVVEDERLALKVCNCYMPNLFKKKLLKTQKSP